MAVFKELRYQYCSAWVSSYFIMETYCSTYVEFVYPVPVPAEYEEPDEVMVVLPPLMDKRQARRPKNHNLIPSKCEVPNQKKCSCCQRIDHKRRNCDAPFPTKSTKNESLSRTNSSGKNKCSV
ncbi:unnamed protein product [Lactuca saligna]|uniref:Uncharacterized protein n=1 Tax=Lactuca saligna TaxID=75948 RepID=A0AA35ZMD2_LACSI|nr:unnamed protein product [Lactuca saligna]